MRNLFGGQASWFQSFGYTVIAISFAALLLRILTAPVGSLLPKLFETSALRMLGRYSYCLYLVHALLRSGLRDLVYKPRDFLSIAGSQIPGQLIFYVLVFGASLMAAMASWYLIETPFLRLKRFFPERMTPR